MRRALALLLIALPALGDEGGGGAPLERLLMARLAFDARLKLADLLREEGKRKEALAAYAQAVAIFETALEAEEPVIEVAGGAGAPLRGRAAVRADNAVERGLKWLAAHQDAEAGNWDADEFMKHDPAADRCDGKGGAAFDVQATGLATLAFLGAGYTDRGAAAENPYGRNVRAALRFLIASQNEDGSFVPALEGNAIATLALCEAYAMTRNPRYRDPASRAIAFLLKQQTAGAGWKDPAGRDASATAWCVSALCSGRAVVGLAVPDQAITDALAWIESVTDKDTGRVGAEAKTEAATAAAIRTRVLCGQAPAAVEAIGKGARLCAAKPPAWNADEGTIDLDYWNWGTLALFQVGGDAWRAWSTGMKAAIVDRQQAAGSRAGSWDPVGVEGGRVMATALMTIDLEVYYRYDRVFGGR